MYNLQSLNILLVTVIPILPLTIVSKLLHKYVEGALEFMCFLFCLVCA